MLRFRIGLSGLIQGPGVQTYHFIGDDTQSGANAAAALLGPWLLTQRGMIATGVTLTLEPEVDVVDAATGLQTGSLTITGTSAVSDGGSEPLPAMTSGLVQWRTGEFNNGVEQRGRTFIPVPPEVYNVNGRPDAGYRGTLQAGADDLLTDGTVSLAVYSRKWKLAQSVDRAAVWTKWASLRSRRD